MSPREGWQSLHSSLQLFVLGDADDLPKEDKQIIDIPINGIFCGGAYKNRHRNSAKEQNGGEKIENGANTSEHFADRRKSIQHIEKDADKGNDHTVNPKGKGSVYSYSLAISRL